MNRVSGGTEELPTQNVQQGADCFNSSYFTISRSDTCVLEVSTIYLLCAMSNEISVIFIVNLDP